ncbi:MAG: hypothetical protein AAFY26_04305 [Cyanobacteria bacterium J06638_22]
MRSHHEPLSLTCPHPAIGHFSAIAFSLKTPALFSGSVLVAFRNLQATKADAPAPAFAISFESAVNGDRHPAFVAN